MIAQIERPMLALFNGSLRLLSDGGLSGVFRVYLQWNDGPKPYLLVDNILTELREGRNKNNVLYWESDVPDGTKEIYMTFHDGGGGGVLQVELEREAGTIYLPTTEWAQKFQDNGKFPTIKVEPDGSLTCLEGEEIDGDFIFGSYIKPFTECAAKNGVSFIMTEVGTDTLDLSPEEYIEYERVWLEMLKKHGIGWMYNCVHNIFGPRTLIWYNGSNIKFQSFSQWEDTGYVVNDDVMNLLKQYQ